MEQEGKKGNGKKRGGEESEESKEEEEEDDGGRINRSVLKQIFFGKCTLLGDKRKSDVQKEGTPIVSSPPRSFACFLTSL